MRTVKQVILLIVILLIVVPIESNSKGRTLDSNEMHLESTVVSDAGIVSAIRGMRAKRAAHTATLLNTGKVLIAGGFVGEGNGLMSAELFDPITNTFTQAENLNTARAGHTATRLLNGKILIAGGYNGDYLDSAELYDPASGKISSTGKMITARSGHVATRLKNGKVLLAGGVGKGWSFLADAELYDPANNTFTATGGLAVPRESHTATLLKDGKVLITGGHKGRRSAITIHTSAEIYDPTTGIFTTTGNLTIKRHKHDATLLADGRVLIVGGSDERNGQGAYQNAEIFNPLTGTFHAVGNMNASRYKLQGTTILLKNGKVLIAGGSNRAEVFDPASNTFSLAGGDMGTPRLFATATMLDSGQVLIAGGYSDGNVVSANAWIYRD
jgi:Kelch motif